MNIRNSRPIPLANRSPFNRYQVPYKQLPGRLCARILAAGRGLLEHVKQGLAGRNDSEEHPEFDTGNSFRALTQVAFAWLKPGLNYASQRLRNADHSSRSTLIGFVSCAVAVVLTANLRSLHGGERPLFFLSAVVVSATLEGLRAGLLTTLLSLLPYLYFLHQAHTAHPSGVQTLPSFILFTMLSLIACALCDSIYLGRQQAETALRQAENLARRSRFVAEASALLDSSRDPITLLRQVTQAIVPTFAEGAIVDLLEARQQVRRVAVTHQDAAKEIWLRDMSTRFPLDAGANHPIADVLRTGEPALFANGSETLLATLSVEANIMASVHQWETQSLLCVPLIARKRVLGTLTCVVTESERQYTPTDLVVAKDLALRIALALDNLRLYQEAQQEILDRARMEQQIREYSLNLEQQRLQLEEANIRLALQVSTDGLTGLKNHLAFQETLAKEIQRAARYQSPLSLLLLDVDHFKQYNDTYGHPAGDQVLKKIAAVLKTSARATDFVARYGGEEFVIILPNTDRAEALDAAERLRRAVEDTRGLERIVTVSIGAATRSDCVSTASELISQADKALYASKHAGRNRFTHADDLHDVTEASSGPNPRLNTVAANALREGTQAGTAQTDGAQQEGSQREETQRERMPQDVAQAYEATIEGWLRLLSLRDQETEDHSRCVTDMTLRLARHLGMNEAELLPLRWGALLHDIGKIGVPDNILLKPGKLTADEWVAMRRHPRTAYEMLSSISFLHHVTDIPYCHHEKWDGSGYPQGLRGEAIPLSARIFAVVDVWDALRSDRPYRPGWPEAQVYDHLQSQAGLHFDPAIVTAFLSLCRDSAATHACHVVPADFSAQTAHTGIAA